MAEVKAKSDDIDVLVKSINKKKSAIDTSVSHIENPSQSSGIMVTSYIKRVKKISSLLKKYKELLAKDAADIQAAKDKIVEMDKTMGNLYETK